MARKKEFDYFGALTELAQKGEAAGKILYEMVENYDIKTVPEKVEKVHQLENEGDDIAHKILDELNRSFITPIDREDIVSATETLDDVLDGINSLMYLFDTYVIEELRPKTEKVAGYVVEATEGVTVATKEFAKFKNSKTLGSMISQINHIEEKTDDLYRALLKELFLNEPDTRLVIKWKAIYEGFEAVINSAELAADTMLGLVIKNT